MITQDQVKEFFYYKRGVLYWKKKTSKYSPIQIGDIAGSIDVYGYMCVKIKDKSYKVHRLIFLMHYGYLPKQIDHKYGLGVGDYLWNLRESTQTENMHNSKIPSNNISGIKGVHWYKKYKKWVAYFANNNKRIHVGYFDDIEVAVTELRLAREKLHGEFTNHG